MYFYILDQNKRIADLYRILYSVFQTEIDTSQNDEDRFSAVEPSND